MVLLSVEHLQEHLLAIQRSISAQFRSYSVILNCGMSK